MRNLLEAAINDNDRDHAVTAIRDALGIVDDEVADYSLPADWSRCDREQRANAPWMLRYGLRTRSGSLAMLLAMRLASSRVSVPYDVGLGVFLDRPVRRKTA